MVGIKNIGYYICEKKECNIGKIFNGVVVSEESIIQKIGIEYVSRKENNEKSSDLCINAFNDLIKKIEINRDEIGVICVCTQNGDFNIPHTSAIVHNKLGLKKECATFDISLGCSGYVYSIDIVKSFMERNNINKGLVFTADPYSEILDKDDKNTNLIFGDAATVTLLCNDPVFEIGNCSYETYSEYYSSLIKEKDKPLFMDGRLIFNFALEYVPSLIEKSLASNNLEKEGIDLYIMHQANKYMINSLSKRLKIQNDKVPLNIKNYGNTVSSSIPIILSEYINSDKEYILLCGFGVGLSISSTIIRKINL